MKGVNMSKKNGILITIISVTAIVISIVAMVIVCKPAGKTKAADTDVQYVLYLGTNDKDTNEPVFSREEAKEKAKEILMEQFGGYTIQEAEGGWIDGDKIYQEYTLVIFLSDTDLEHVHAAADKMVETFHQSSVLIQANQTVTEFYEGAGK